MTKREADKGNVVEIKVHTHSEASLSALVRSSEVLYWHVIVVKSAAEYAAVYLSLSQAQAQQEVQHRSLSSMTKTHLKGMEFQLL